MNSSSGTIVIFALLFMFLIYGYFNFTADKKTEQDITPTIENTQDLEYYRNLKENTPGISKNTTAPATGDSNFSYYKDGQKKSQTSTEPNISKLPLSTLIKKSGSYQCTWDYKNQNNSEVYGSSFISNSMALIELRGTINNTNYKTFFLTRDGYVYQWSTSVPDSGYKTKVSNQNLNYNKTGYLITDEEIIKNPSYYCQVWNNPTLGTFTIPKLKFKEI